MEIIGGASPVISMTPQAIENEFLNPSIKT